MKKILAVLLALCMVFAMMPIAAMAEESALEPLTGVGIEFSADKAPVAEDWTLTGSNSKVNADSIYLDAGNKNSYITGTYNGMFNLTNGFTATYVVGGRYYNNYAKGNTYLGISVGNITVGPEVLDSDKSAVVLKIRINNTVVATSSNIFDSTSSGWNSSKSNAANINNFMGGFAVNTLTLDYDTETKTLTYGYGDKVVTYVDEAGAIDVSAATVALKTHASWSGYASYKSLKLEGKTASLKSIYVAAGGFNAKGFNTTDWTGNTDSAINASGDLCAPASSSSNSATYNSTYTSSGERLDIAFNFTYGNTDNAYGNLNVKFGTNTISINDLNDGSSKSYAIVVSNGAGQIAYSYIGDGAGVAGGDYTFTYENGVLSGTHKGEAINWEVADGTATAVEVAFDEVKDGTLKVSVGGNWIASRFVKNFSFVDQGTSMSLYEINEAMGTLADASLETYADAAALIDTVVPLLSQSHKDLLTNLAVYEQYKADYTTYNADKEADAAIVAKNATYKLVNGFYAEDWQNIKLGDDGHFYRGDTDFYYNQTTTNAKGDGFYANDRNHHTMTSAYPLATADYFKITQKISASDYQDTYFKWTIGDLAVGIYNDGNNTSPDGDTGVTDGNKMAVFKIFYKGEVVKIITGEANNYGHDVSVDACSTWMTTNCEFTITYDKGNLKITFYNGATKYITAKTGFDLTAVEGFNYRPNGKYVDLDIYTSYSKLYCNTLTITGKANKAAVDNLAALAQTNVNAAKNIYDTLSDKSIVDDATAAILNGEFAVSAENATYTASLAKYRYGDTVTFTATSDGAFIGWYDGEGNLLTTDAAYTCVIEPGKTIVAKAEEGCAHANTTTVVENKVDADCVNGGSYDNVVKCAECGEEISRETVTTEALGHDYTSEVTAPTCTTGGYTTYTCAVCGDEYVADQVSALGHDVVVDEAVAPTLNSTGLTEGAHCGTCGEVLVAQEVVPMIVGEASIVGGLNYATLEEAVAAAVDGDVIVLNLDVTTEAILVIDKAITLNGYGHTLTYTGKGTEARAINVKVAGDVTIYDLVIEAVDAERAINVITYPANLVVEKVTAVASHYPVNVAGSAAGATVTINDSDLTGLNVVNIRANNVTVEINGSKLTVIDETDTESYSAIFVGKEVVDGSVAMNGGEVVLGGDSSAASYWSNVEVTFTDVIGVDKVVTVVATIGEAGYTSLAEAVADAKDGETITLIRDITLTEYVKIAKKVTIDLNGFSITADFVSAYGAIYVAPAGDLTIKGAGTITSTDIAIGNYGKLAIDGATVNGDYASIYNFYYNATTYGKATINGTVEGWVLNCGEMTIDGSVAWVDNSGALAVNGDVEYIYARDGGDAAGVEGAGTIAVADPSAIEVPEDYKLVETADGVYAVVAKEYVAQVGDVKYESFELAISEAADGDTIVLLNNVALTESVKIAKKVTIDLNGNNITADIESAYGAIYVAKAGDLTVKGEGTITNTDIAIGVYGKLAIDGATVSGDYASIYNFYYDANTYGKATINGTVEGWVLNCGDMAIVGGTVDYVDNSGALAIDGGAVEYIYARDGGDAAGVEGAGTIAIADPSAIEVPEGYVLLEVEEGIYVAHAHEYDADVTAPTCTADGYTTYTCDCGDEYVADVVPALGHDYEADVTAPTCTEDGYTTYTCAVCGDSYVADEVPATGHNYDADVTAPTCGAEGYTTYTCAVCGDSYVADEVPATGHAWGEWEITTEAVGTAAGIKTKTCGTCGATETQEYYLETSGTTGDVTWRFDNGTLYIEGTGKMANYANVGDVAPWQTVRKETTAIVIGDGVTYIGNRSFKGFNKVTTVTIGKDVTTMGYECFYACNKITSINLPEGLTHLGALTFFNCTGLTQIDIPASVTNIENRAFKGSGLTSVVVPDTVTKMGYEVFMNCAALAEVDFTTGVSMLQPRTFENCTSLTTFEYTRNMCRIRTRAFYGCTALESVVFEDADNMWGSSNGNEARIASDAFAGCNATLKLIAEDDTHVEQYAASKGFVFEAK